MEWIPELLKKIAYALAIKAVLAGVEVLPGVKRHIVSGYYRHCYYPGSALMSTWCWLKHPISGDRRAEAQFTAGWNWPDPDEVPVG